MLVVGRSLVAHSLASQLPYQQLQQWNPTQHEIARTPKNWQKCSRKWGKNKKAEEKAQIAAKEAAKEAKADAKAAKARENQKKKEEKAALKVKKKNDDETQKKQKVETGASDSKDPAARKSCKRKVEPKENSPRVGRARLTETPCKIRDPHGNAATPAKIKQKRKREEKAKQSLAKLRRQKEFLPDLKDLTELDDESKMTLERFK